MKKIILCFAFLICMFSVLDVYAGTDAIKVGLLNKYKELSSVSIKNNNILVGYENNSEFLNSGTIVSGEGFNAFVSSKYYIRPEQTFSNYSVASEFSNTLSAALYKACPALIDTNVWCVYIGGFDSLNEAEAAKLNIGLVSQTVTAKNRIILETGHSPVMIFDNPSLQGQIKSADNGPVLLGDTGYRGRIEFNLRGAYFTAVNILSVEEYLYGVLPAEIGPSWHTEALKAQAVASRTYIYTKISSHNDAGYNVCDLSHCQNYRGASSETDSTTKAVDDTRGAMIYYNNQKIEAMYHASGGGYTESAENVWSNRLAYLNPVKEPDGVYESPWTRTFTLKEIEGLLSKNNVNIGSVKGVRISVDSQSGRVQELIIEGTGGNKSYIKENIRTFFSSSSGGSLNSRRFVILNAVPETSGSNISQSQDTGVYIQSASSVVFKDIKALNACNQNGGVVSVNGTFKVVGKGTGAEYGGTAFNAAASYYSSSDTVTFSGKGFGHGVGMSQYGAKNMAESGYKYDQILKFYYTGVEIR